MMSKILDEIKKEIGYIIRGVYGFIINNLERIPSLGNNKKIIIAKSIKNRPIECYKIGEGNIKVIFISSIHGNETGTVKMAYYLINWLQSENLELKRKFKFFVIPCLNPDGHALAIKNPNYFSGGKIGRHNANNVDLNRNFNTPGFKKESVHSFGKNYKEKEKVYCGEYGNSEPETKGLVNFIKKEGIKVLFAFHNMGRDVMGNNLNLSQDLIKIYSKKCGFRIIDDKGWVKLEQTGTLKEWCEINNIVYIETEGSTRWGSDWKIQKDAIISTILALKETAIK